MADDIELIDPEEMLAGLVEFTSGNTGAALTILDKTLELTKQAIIEEHKKSNTPLLDKTLVETAKQETLRRTKSNLDHELKLGRRRAQYRVRINMIKALCRFADEPDITFHHLVALTDERAKVALQILIDFEVDINSIANACALPRFVSKTPHLAMLEAYAHSKVHTNIYYENVTIVLLRVTEIPGATQEDIIKALNQIGRQLQAGTFPLYEKMKK